MLALTKKEMVEPLPHFSGRCSSGVALNIVAVIAHHPCHVVHYHTTSIVIHHAAGVVLGAASNIVIIEAAESRGVHAFSFFECFKVGSIVTASNIAVYYVFIVLI